MAIQYNSDEMYEKYRLTDEQIKACKKVFKAMREAGKLGVQFWDMYGQLTAYNGNVFERLNTDEGFNSPTGIKLTNCDAGELLYSETLTNLRSASADDDVWGELKDEIK